MKYLSRNLQEMKEIASDVVGKILTYGTSKGNSDKAVVVGLYGNLGAGKTTLAQLIARGFGVEDDVTSPTFVIEKIYDIGVAGRPFFHLIHIDAYRLEKSEELLHLGWEEIIKDNNNIILIEWPEKVSNIMPKHIQIHLKTDENDESRHVEIMV